MDNQSLSFSSYELLEMISNISYSLYALHYASLYGFLDVTGDYAFLYDKICCALLAIHVTILMIYDLFRSFYVRKKFASLQMLFHHMVCISCNIFALTYADFKFGLLMYMSEISTPLLMIRNKLKENGVKGPKYDIMNGTFGIVFIIFRLLIFPRLVLYNFFYVVFPNMCNHTSNPAQIFISFSSLILLVLNIYWGILVIKGFIKYFDKK